MRISRPLQVHPRPTHMRSSFIVKHNIPQTNQSNRLLAEQPAVPRPAWMLFFFLISACLTFGWTSRYKQSQTTVLIKGPECSSLDRVWTTHTQHRHTHLPSHGHAEHHRTTLLAAHVSVVGFVSGHGWCQLVQLILICADLALC